MPDPVIHVGLPKTGTTFIQNEVLEKSDQIFYVGRPYTQEGRAFNMIQYCDDTLYDEAAVRDEINALKRRAEGRKIVISDEMLAGSPLFGFRNRSSIARRLHRYFPDARIVVCLRNQVDILASYFRQVTAVGWNGSVLDERYVHGTGNGLSFDAWQEEADWDKSRRFVSHHSMMSMAYFKYSTLLDLYDQLFDDVTVLLYEDFRDKRRCFFEAWASVAGSSEEEIRKRANRKVNATGEFPTTEEMMSNRVASLFENISLRGKKLVEMAVAKILRPLLNRDPVRREDLVALARQEGIPDDNRRLSKMGVSDLERYASEYLLE